MKIVPFAIPQIISHSELMASSFEKVVGRRLIEADPTHLSNALYNAPFIIVSHGVEQDPIFNYANAKAQELWEMDWDQFTLTPSRLSAEAVTTETREKLLQQARDTGYVDQYTGIRISTSGRRFYIRNTILWNLLDAEGVYKGQAAVFSEWDYI